MPSIELRHQCCMEYMAGLPDKAFDLALVDPPYGIGVNSMNMGGRKTVRPDARNWDDAIPTPLYFEELRRVSVNQLIWGGNYFPLPQGPCFVVWDKAESMYGRDFAEAELCWGSFDRPARIWKGTPNQPDRIHPTQKPVALYRWLLKNYAKPGQRILDTHLGSGSSAIACDLEGFDFTGTEIDLDYYLGAAKRLKDHQSAPRLFAPEAIVQPVQTSLYE